MSLILYLLQVTCCLAFFYGFYHMTLRKETLFETNRFYLITTLVASIALPLIKIYIDSLPSDPAFVYVGSYVDALVIENAVSQRSPFPWDRLIMGIYFLGIAVMTVRLLNALRDIQWIRQHGVKTMVEGHYCILSERVKSPFSFFNSIYFPKDHQFDESELKEIVAHELAHVEGRHTLDVLLMEAACILLWPSPLIYVYRKALKDVHEFVADAAVIRDTPWEQYAQLLVGQQQGQLQNILSNQLIYSQLKKRLHMMNQERSGFTARFKYLGFIPVVLIALFLFSFREKPTVGDNLAISDNVVQDADTVILYLTDDKRIFLGPQEIARDEIESKVKEASKNIPDPVVIVLLENSKDVLVGELADIMQIGTKMHMKWISYIDDEGKFDAYKSAIKSNTLFSSDNKSDASRLNTPTVLQMPQEKSDTLPETYVVAFRTIQPKDANDISSFPGGTSAEDMKRYGYERQLPIFPGCELVPIANQGQCGMEKFGEYINENMVYPESVKKAGIEGRVVVKFVVGADGYIKDQISITESLHPDADLVVLRMFQDMNSKVGKWMPARKEGKSVDAEMHLPIQFALSENQTKVEPFKQVDELARFPGCEHLTNVDERNNCAQEQMFKFVFSNIKYPNEDREKGIQGTGIIQFVINTDGKISDVEILRSPSAGIKTELERLMKDMASLPNSWVPAIKDGKPVPYQLILPVQFKLQDDESPNPVVPAPATESSKEMILEVSPNPAKEIITVSVFEGAHTIKVFDTTGNQVLTQKLPASRVESEQINVWGLKPGQYVVQVIGATKKLSGAFTIIK